MSYFPDLSGYEYTALGSREGTLNVGWLAIGHDFPTAVPTDSFLDRLWRLCTVSFVQTRGIHDCELCSERDSWVQRGSSTLMLGGSEIRVFANSGTIYAAPTQLFHYVARHHYRPPTQFVDAVESGPLPPEAQFFAQATHHALEWNWTWNPAERPERRRLGPKGWEKA